MRNYFIQDIDTEITVGSEISNVGSNNAAVPQSVSPQVLIFYYSIEMIDSLNIDSNRVLNIFR